MDKIENIDIQEVNNKIQFRFNKEISMRKNFTWTFIGNGFYNVCQWGMLASMAKLGSPEMVGQFSLSLAITVPVFMFSNLQLRNIQATDARNEYAFGDYLGIRIITTILALIIVGLVVVSGKYSINVKAVIIVMALAKGFESISDVIYGLLQKHERMDRISISMMIKGAISLLALGSTLCLTHNLMFSIISMSLVWMVLLLTYDTINGKSYSGLKPAFNAYTLRSLVNVSLPMGIASMLISLNANIPIYFIEKYLGSREVGIFSALAYIMTAGRMIVSSLGQSASPRMARYYADGNKVQFRMLLFKMIGLGILLGLFGITLVMIAGREIVTIMYNREYAQQINTFILIMIASGINYIVAFLGYSMTAARYFNIQLPLILSVTIITIITSAIMIPGFGLKGAAWSLILTSIAQLTGSILINLHVLHKI